MKIVNTTYQLQGDKVYTKHVIDITSLISTLSKAISTEMDIYKSQVVDSKTENRMNHHLKIFLPAFFEETELYKWIKNTFKYPFTMSYATEVSNFVFMYEMKIAASIRIECDSTDAVLLKLKWG